MIQKTQANFGKSGVSRREQARPREAFGGAEGLQQVSHSKAEKDELPIIQGKIPAPGIPHTAQTFGTGYHSKLAEELSKTGTNSVIYHANSSLLAKDKRDFLIYEKTSPITQENGKIINILGIFNQIILKSQKTGDEITLEAFPVQNKLAREHYLVGLNPAEIIKRLNKLKESGFLKGSAKAAADEYLIPRKTIEKPSINPKFIPFPRTGSYLWD